MHNTAILILHGAGNDGIESSFISKIFSSLADLKSFDVYAINMPYCERADSRSSGPELIEEVETLNNFYSSHISKYSQIIIIGKSLGGLIANFWLTKYPNHKVNKIIILGILVNEYHIESYFDKHLVIIQGELDKYGSPKVVNDYLLLIPNKEIIIFPNADYSYRDTNNQPIYQEKVIDILKEKVLS